tara:strand:- start:2494 stop:2868 length:375 start_codon:yes stop_codon:yes gene_type:complete
MAYRSHTDYAFGQLGSGFLDGATLGNSLTPPTGKVIVAISFLATTQLDVLTPATDGLNNGASTASDPGDLSFGITTPDDGHGANSEAISTAQKFPAGMTIYGRWTAVSMQTADADGGMICYFGY